MKAKFEQLYLSVVEAASIKQKDYAKKYQAKKRAEKRMADVADLESDVRNTAFMSFEDDPEQYTLDNLVGRIVDFELRTGEKLRGIVQKPRDSVLDTAGKGSLRVLLLNVDSPRIEMVPKIWITSAKVGDREVRLLPKETSSLKPGESMRVKGSGTNIYKVKRDKNDKWTCTCPAFAWQKGDCKHIRGVKSGEIK